MEQTILSIWRVILLLQVAISTAVSQECTEGRIMVDEIQPHLAAGRVFLCYNGEWRAICHHGWDIRDAGVVCRQLGFPAQGAQYCINSCFGSSANRGLTRFSCSGEETNLQQCSFSTTKRCLSGETIGMVCCNSEVSVHSSPPPVTLTTSWLQTTTVIPTMSGPPTCPPMSTQDSTATFSPLSQTTTTLNSVTPSSSFFTTAEEAPPTEGGPPTEGTPPTSEAPPTHEEATSTTEETAPTSEEATSTTEETAPTSEEATSTTEETAPTSEEATSTTEETAPTSEEATSTTEETAPTSEEATSTTEETAPTSEKATVSEEAISTSKPTNEALVTSDIDLATAMKKCPATECNIIAGVLGTVSAILLLSLVGVVTGWVWSCRRKKETLKLRTEADTMDINPSYVQTTFTSTKKEAITYRNKATPTSHTHLGDDDYMEMDRKESVLYEIPA